MEKAIAWLDVEVNGRMPEIHELLEAALVVTDFRGNLVADPYTTLVKVPSVAEALKNAEPVAKEIHEVSGLWKELWESNTAKAPVDVDRDFCEILESISEETVFFVGGNSISLDRSFASVYLPKFTAKVSHMSVDVTSIASMLQENSLVPRLYKKPKHRALDDVFDSIDEYRYHLTHLLDNPEDLLEYTSK